LKIYISMNALPWESFTMTLPDPQNDGNLVQVKAASNASRAGFLPLFWSAEEAEKTFPGYPIQQAEVPDDWNPWLNAQPSNLQAAVKKAVHELGREVAHEAQAAAEETIIDMPVEA